MHVSTGGLLMKKMTIIGAGAFGFALAKHLSHKFKSDHDYHKYNDADIDKIMIYDVDSDVIEHMKTERSQKNLFPAIKLNDFVHPTTDLKEALVDSEIIIISIPTQFIRSFFEAAHDYIGDYVTIINASKGLEVKTNEFISDIVHDEMSKLGLNYTFACLSGGMIASEFVSGFGIFGAEISCESETVGKYIQALFSSKRLRVYLNDDVRGVEAAGALKNVISIAAGFSDGLGYPYGSKTLIVTLGAYDLMNLALKLGAKPHTFSLYTQAFGNDYLMSTTGNTRNRYLGELIGKGMKPEDAINQMKVENKTAEGYFTVKVAYNMARKFGIKTPIIDLVHRVLFEGGSPKELIQEIMASDLEPIIDSGYCNCSCDNE